MKFLKKFFNREKDKVNMVNKMVFDISENPKFLEYKKHIFEKSCLEGAMTVMADIDANSEKFLMIVKQLCEATAMAELTQLELLKEFKTDDIKEIIHYGVDMINEQLLVCVKG